MLSHNQIAAIVRKSAYAGSVTTAYHYLADLASSVGRKEAAYLFSGGVHDYGLVAKAARKRLVLHSPQLAFELCEKAAGSSSGGIELPDGVSAEVVLRVSTRDKDLDGDIVHPDGLVFDMRGPLLWMHAQNMPIGTMRQVVEQDEQKAICRYHAAETQLALDSIKLFKIGALRSSIGFKVLEAEPLGFVDGQAGKQVPTGFDIKRALVLENSAVAVPANPNTATLQVYAKQYDAIWDAASRKEFLNPVVRKYAEVVYEKRPKVFKGADMAGRNDNAGGNADTSGQEVNGKMVEILKEISEKLSTKDVSGHTADKSAQSHKAGYTLEVDGKSMHWGTDEYMDGSHEKSIDAVNRHVKKYMCEKGECDDDYYPAVMATYPDKAYVCMRKWTRDGYDRKNYQVDYSMADGKCTISGHKKVRITHNLLDDMDPTVVAKWMEIDGIKQKSAGTDETKSLNGGERTTQKSGEQAAASAPSLRQLIAKGVVDGFDAETEKMLRDAVKFIDSQKQASELACFAGSR